MSNSTFSCYDFVEFFKSIANMYILRKGNHEYDIYSLLVERAEGELDVNFFIISNGLKVTFSGRHRPWKSDDYIIIEVSGYNPDDINESRYGAGNLLNLNVDDKLKRLVIDNIDIFNKGWDSVK